MNVVNHRRTISLTSIWMVYGWHLRLSRLLHCARVSQLSIVAVNVGLASSSRTAHETWARRAAKMGDPRLHQRQRLRRSSSLYVTAAVMVLSDLRNPNNHLGRSRPPTSSNSRYFQRNL